MTLACDPPSMLKLNLQKIYSSHRKRSNLILHFLWKKLIPKLFRTTKAPSLRSSNERINSNCLYSKKHPSTIPKSPHLIKMQRYPKTNAFISHKFIKHLNHLRTPICSTLPGHISSKLSRLYALPKTSKCSTLGKRSNWKKNLTIKRQSIWILTKL